MEHSHMLNARYNQTWLLEDVEERIQVLRNAWAVLSGERPDLGAAEAAVLTHSTDDEESNTVLACLLHGLSVALGDCYQHTGRLENLDERIYVLQLASGTLRHDTILASAIQCELGAAFRTRFFYAGDSTDILQALNIHSSLLDQHSNVDRNRARLLYELGHSLFVHYGKFGGDDDLTRSIALLNEGIQLLPESCSHRHTAQNTLARALWMGHYRGGNISFLHDAIAILRNLVRSQPSNHRERWNAYNTLSSCMGVLYGVYSHVTCLQEAIECARHGLDFVNITSPDHVRPALVLAGQLTKRFGQLGNIEDLHESLEVLKSCLNIPNTFRPSFMSQMTYSLDCRYERLGAAEDLDESIRLLREVVIAFPQGHPQHQISVNNLADSVFKRYQRDKRASDITEAIGLYREAIPHSQQIDWRGVVCFNLAACLCQYHGDFGDGEKLAEAITICETWMAQSSGEGDQYGRFMRTYAQAITRRYESYHNTEDLSLAISRFGEALGYRPAGHPERAQTLIALAGALYHRIELSYSRGDVEQAVNLLMEARDCLPDGHPGRATPWSGYTPFRACPTTSC